MSILSNLDDILDTLDCELEKLADSYHKLVAENDALEELIQTLNGRVKFLEEELAKANNPKGGAWTTSTVGDTSVTWTYFSDMDKLKVCGTCNAFAYQNRMTYCMRDLCGTNSRSKCHLPVNKWNAYWSEDD